MSDTACMSLWDQAEPVFREKAYRTIERDPQILLEGDGGPGSVQAEVYMARLYGYDDEIVADGLRLPRPEAVYLMPIMSQPAWMRADEDMQPALIRTATYVLQSGFALVKLAPEYAPPGVTLGDDFTFRVLYLRYRRRDR